MTVEIHFSDQVVHRFIGRSPRDRANAERLQQLIWRGVDPYGRLGNSAHVTATAFVVDHSRQRTLLLYHRKLQIWLPPGGHCDGDADVMRAALREACEETGLTSLKPVEMVVFDIDIHVIPSHGGQPEHEHFDVRFLLEADHGEPLVKNAESEALRWVDLSELETFTDLPSVLILKEKLGMT